MKKIIVIFIGLIFISPIQAQSVSIIKSAGWLESAYVEWAPVTEAQSYNVYYSGAGISDKKIDTQLIRNYGTYFRADILGLKAGIYTIKVVPVISDVESVGTITPELIVVSHDRSGFGFWNGRIPGAYKVDGTPKDGAVILYITENSKNTISMDVTGANTNPCVGLQNILDGFKKGNDTRPLIVRLVGQITDLDYMLNGDIVIENKNNILGHITMEGVGEDAVADGWGLRIKNASNIEVRNIGFMNCNSDEGDNVGLQQDNDYIWVHNCDMFYGNSGSDADQIKGDGALDCKKSTYVTFSYNHFWDSGKSNLLGLSEGTTSGLFITYHHNWYDHSDSRHPRVRFYSAHVYNNYYDGIAKYGVGSTEGSSVFVEANYFRNCKYPMLISMQGSDVWNETTQTNDYKNMPTFSSEDGGIIKAFNNYMTGQRRFVPYGDANYINSTVDFDAYVVSNRTDQVPSNTNSAYGANTYNNFDTNSSVMYNYTPDSPEDAETKVMQYAGRVTGGDLKWTFDNSVDDASYAVNSGLKSALTNYKTTLVSVQGDTTSTEPGGDPEPSPGDMIHNFTLSGKTSSFYTITGNLSTSYGSVNYNGLTLTQCLKIESSTNITFTTTQSGTVTLVFNSSYSGTVKIDGTVYTPSSGIITATLTSGAHTIVKGSGSNYLFYMNTIYDSTGVGIINNSKTAFYPNPITRYLYAPQDIELEQISIYSLSGTVLRQIKGNVKNIDLIDLTPGSYLLKAKTKQGMILQIIIKSK
ncbi:Candidate pectin or pectate lyase (fragment) [uncultured Paludibacter sp.]|uniref:Candidate pectin or pectate lyase n=1 Tax=uncultured Paludibacter sp. TaxID=497635 RepID=A0A653AK30_9BACT